SRVGAAPAPCTQAAMRSQAVTRCSVPSWAVFSAATAQAEAVRGAVARVAARADLGVEALAAAAARAGHEAAPDVRAVDLDAHVAAAVSDTPHASTNPADTLFTRIHSPHIHSGERNPACRNSPYSVVLPL